MLVVLRMD